ncbi:MAG: hypothetical protein SFY68_04645 [Candidatus Sumerlaeia bacterium]|nr:hypothetical protein [Candidatus Sumerlaeia bacterium]
MKIFLLGVILILSTSAYGENPQPCFNQEDLLKYSSDFLRDRFPDNRLVYLVGNSIDEACDCEKISFLYRQEMSPSSYHLDIINIVPIQNFHSNYQDDAVSFLECYEKLGIIPSLVSEQKFSNLDKAEFIKSYRLLSKSDFEQESYSNLMNATYDELESPMDFHRFNKILSKNDYSTTSSENISLEFIRTLNKIRENPDPKQTLYSNHHLTHFHHLINLIEIVVKTNGYKDFNNSLNSSIRSSVDLYLFTHVFIYFSTIITHDGDNTSIHPQLANLFDHLIESSSTEQRNEIYSLFSHTLMTTSQDKNLMMEKSPQLIQFYTNVLLPRAKIDASEIPDAKAFVDFFE